MTKARRTAPKQLEFFPSYYMSQQDAARSLSISVRLIQYWESQGLLHPELAQVGRNRRYSPRDVQELQFIKAHLVDFGYSLPVLKTMLAQLEPPYAYDPARLYWHPGRGCWTSDSQTARHVFATRWPELATQLVQALASPHKGAANSLVETTRQVIEHWVQSERLQAVWGPLGSGASSTEARRRRAKGLENPQEPRGQSQLFEPTEAE